MLDFRKLALLSDEELGRYDIVETHLACAVGLPGSEKIDEERCFKRIDYLVAWVRKYTEHCLAHPDPANGGDTEGVFRMRALLTCLWKGAKIRYNAAKIPDDAPWDLADSFIHGALFGDGGTCSSLPVLYTAIGRRLGYPLKLVSSWGPKWNHLFCRWDDPDGERFNVEASSTGVGFDPDDHYRRHGQERHLEEKGRFLLSKTPREELAGFLISRAYGWLAAGRRRLTVDAFAWAAGLCPDNGFHVNTLKLRYNEWLDEVNQRKPPGFPKLWLKVYKRRYPFGLPFDLERDILCLETTENVLNDPEIEGRWWAALRQGHPGIRTPREALVDSWADRIDVRFQS